MQHLVKPEFDAPTELLFDASQQAVLDAPDRVLHVVGAPGTGKTTLAVEIVARAVEAGLTPDQCVLLSPTRVMAGHLRSWVTARIGGTSQEPIARTPQALAFGILRARAALEGLPAPRLLSGPEQDVVLKELLAGHAQGLGAAPHWPDDLAEALTTRGFRNELRDLLMRAVEWGVGARELDRLGREHGMPQWCAAAAVLDEYDDVTALSRPGAFDPAWILGGAAAALQAAPDLLAHYRDQFQLVVVDDAQELTRAGVTFLTTLVGPTQRVVLIGDPDVTVQGFRGADPRFMPQLATDLGATHRLHLGVGYRQPQALAAVRERASARIGSVDGVAHRAVASRPGGEVAVALLRSGAQQAAHIAGVLRRAHLIDGIPWKDMAVIVRGSGGSAALRRALNAARVPVAVPAASLALRDEPAVRPFLQALEIVTSGVDTVADDLAVDLLTSPLGAADPVVLRRLRRVLRRQELEDGGSRTSDELLGAALLEEAREIAPVPETLPVRRVAAVLRAGRAAWVSAAPLNDAEHVLWAMWQASGLAEPWEATALDGGVAGTRADRDLDAVLALFGAAATFVDRLPGASARDFLDHIRQQDVPGDRLVAAAPDDEAVALLTPAGAAGRQWHTVVIAGVQDGVWPDLRLRGSILGSEALVDVLSGRGRGLAAAQAAVRYDETRQFVMALSRARERVLVTAVRDEDEQPSVYLDLVDPIAPNAHGEGLRPFTDVARPMTLAGVVAESRRMLASDDENQRVEAAERLARLAAAEVPGADPAQWWALVSLSDDRPLRAPELPVRVSPSKVEGFNRCGLNWLLTTSGGYGPSIGASTVGTLVHELAQEFSDIEDGRARREALRSALAERWPRLGLGESWISRQKLAEAELMVERLATYFDDAAAAGWQQVASEERFSARTGRAKISGSIDRIERRSDGALRVIDYKTGGTAVKADDLATHQQLAVYQVAVEAGAFGSQVVNAGAALVQLGKAAGKKPLPKVQGQPALSDPEPGADTAGEPQPGSRQWAFDLVAATAEGMAASTFTAAQNTLCQVCPVRSSCPIQPEGRTLS